jgi:hypothetical protein
MLEQNDEWTISRRYMSLESLAPVSDSPMIRLPGVAVPPPQIPVQIPSPQATPAARRKHRVGWSTKSVPCWFRAR